MPERKPACFKINKQQARDEVAGNDEKYVNSNISSRERPNVGMEQDDREYGQGAEAVNVWAVVLHGIQEASGKGAVRGRSGMDPVLIRVDGDAARLWFGRRVLGHPALQLRTHCVVRHRFGTRYPTDARFSETVWDGARTGYPQFRMRRLQGFLAICK